MPILGSSASQSGKLSGVPTIGTATTSGTTATVSFTAPAHVGKGGSVTYTATSSPSGITGTSASSPITVSGLTAGSSYTFTVTATNANGTSTASSASNSITVVVPRNGYWVGGNSIGTKSEVFKISFSNDSVSTLAATIGRSAHGAYANSGTAGYAMGGGNLAGSSETSTYSKLTFSSDAASTLGATLSANHNNGGGCANSGTAGYHIGGGGGANGTTINKLTFSNESNSVLSASIATFSYYIAACANSGTAGYYHRGEAFISTIDKLTFSNDTKSTLSATVHSGFAALSGFYSYANSGTAGFFFGGRDSSQRYSTSGSKLAFSNDTRSNVDSIVRNSSQWLAAGIANSGTAGYATGGREDGGLNSGAVTKHAFSNDTGSTIAAQPPRGGLQGHGFANVGTL